MPLVPSGPPEGGDVSGALFLRRILQLRGPLDEAAAGDLVTRLMYLDADGDEAVTLYVDSPGGALEPAFSVVDTVELLGVPVDTVCVGRAEGSAVAVVAAGRRRLVARHGRLRLAEPDVEVAGGARQIATWAEHHRAQSERFSTLLSRLSGRPREHIEADLELGRWVDAEGAVALGLVDGVWEGGRSRQGGVGDRPPFGFR